MDHIELQTQRALALEAFRNYTHVELGYRIPAADSAEELLALARRLDTREIEAANGWRTEPPFPGLGEKPERMPVGWRMICASKLFAGNEAIGFVFTTLVSGRPTSMVINNPDYAIPKEYSPIHVR
jgi:hypothetical protein